MNARTLYDNLKKYFKDPTKNAISHVFNMALGPNMQFVVSYRMKSGETAGGTYLLIIIHLSCSTLLMRNSLGPPRKFRSWHMARSQGSRLRESLRFAGSKWSVLGIRWEAQIMVQTSKRPRPDI